MKHQIFLGFVLCICTLVTFSQTPVSKDTRADKSSLFATLPTKSVCNRLELEKIIQLPIFSRVSLPLDHNIVLSGEVIEKVEPAAGIKNINIRLSNFGNALLHVTFHQQQDNTYKITGRIVHPKNAEAVVISEENGKYYLTKHKMEFFMVE
jgi:hypothetical protein